MSFRKMLGIISVFILIMFGLMLSSSYAWYSFTNGGTFFSTNTANDAIKVDYNTGKYINTNTGVPVLCDDIDDSDDVGRNSFSVSVKGKSVNNDILVSIKLIDVSIDEELKNENFQFELLYNNHIVNKGNFKDITGDSFVISDGIILDGNASNDFELRVYILDNNKDQNMMMNKTFKATISVDVVSRNDSSFDFKASSISVDGKKKNNIPTKGLYNLTSNSCEGKLTWNKYTKTVNVMGGVNNYPKVCDFQFTKDTSYLKMSEVVKQGDYISYSKEKGVNVCPTDVSLGREFYVSGWRVAYIDNATVYLISASSIRCISTGSDGSINNKNIDNFDTSNGVINHLSNMNKTVISNYCDSNYAYDGKCNNSSAWAMNANDFNKITGSLLSGGSCFKKNSDMGCGYNNDLIDNGGYYWIADAVSSNSNSLFYWNPVRRFVDEVNSNYAYGVRPVIRLDSSVYITGGTGSLDDPYTIGN